MKVFNWLFIFIVILLVCFSTYILRLSFESTADMHWHQAQFESILEWNKFHGLYTIFLVLDNVGD